MKQQTRFKKTEIGMIPEEWEVEKVDNLYEISSGLSKPRNEFGFGYPFLSFKNIFDNFSLPEELHELVNSTEKERKYCSIMRGDVFLTRTSETIGELGMSSVALKNYKNATFNGFAKRLRPKRKDIILPEFAVYLFRSNKIRSQILTFSSLTTRASLNASMIKEIRLIIPSLTEQSAMATILSDLDSKIELNRQMAATLESIGQSIFRHWFIDFEFPNEKGEPHKSSGGEMVDSKLGKIPKGWKVLKMEAVVAEKKFSIVDGPFGTQLHSEEYIQEGIPVIRVINLSFEGKFERDSLVYISEEKFQTLMRSVIYPGDILLAKTGATIGKLARCPKFIENGIVASSVMKISPNLEKLNKHFLFNIIKILSEQRYWESISGGSTRPTINIPDVKGIELIYPSESIMKKYHSIVDSLYRKIEDNEQEIFTLSSIRDSLLPKLMSGRIRVPVGSDA